MSSPPSPPDAPPLEVHDLTVAYEIVELSRPQASSDAEGQAALA